MIPACRRAGEHPLLRAETLFEGEQAAVDRDRKLAELVADACYAISDLLDEEGWEAFEERSDIEKLQWRYCHADCDAFALTLHQLTGWPIVALRSVRGEPLHRLVEGPDGRLLDARGWCTLETAARHYKRKRIVLVREGVERFTEEVDEDEVRTALEVIGVLPDDPFPSLKTACNASLATYQPPLHEDVTLSFRRGPQF